MGEVGTGAASRRLVLKVVAGSLVAPVLAASARAASAVAAPVDLAPARAGAPPGDAAPGEPRALLHAYRRVRYSAGEGVTFWWMRATKYGLVDTKLTPLFGMEIGNFSRARDAGPDAFSATQLEMVFFTDLATGAHVDSIVNPYTGERIARGDSLVGPATITYTLDGPRYPAALPGVRFDIEPATGFFAVEGDDVWLRDDNATTVTPVDAGAPRFRVTDHSTYHCSRAALADESLASVPATVTFGSFSTWIDWMKMGERPGNMVSRASGRKFARLEDMPPRFLGLLRERHPELAKDPAAALDRPPFSFSP
jgi:hypothetical protein